MLCDIAIKGEVLLPASSRIERPVDEPRLETLRALVGYGLRRAAGRMMSDLRTTLSPLGLRPVLYAIIEMVRAEPGIIQMAVGTELGIQRANLVPLVNDLESRGLLERRVARHDRRAFALFLTPQGKELHEKATKLILEHEERTVGSLSSGERETLLELLERVAVEKGS